MLLDVFYLYNVPMPLSMLAPALIVLPTVAALETTS